MLRLLIVGFCLCLGILFPVLGIRDHQLGKSSETWPSVQGIIVSEHRKMVKKTRYSIFYEYEVDGQRYKNSRVNFQNDKASKRELYQSHNKGDLITVHYDPDSPQQSVLKTGNSFSTLVIKILSGFFCLGLALFFWRALRRRA